MIKDWLHFFFLNKHLYQKDTWLQSSQFNFTEACYFHKRQFLKKKINLKDTCALYFTSQVKKIQRTFLFLSFQICDCTWKTPDALNMGEVLGQQDNDIDNWKKKLFDVMINEYMKIYEKVRSWLLQLNFVLCKDSFTTTL